MRIYNEDENRQLQNLIKNTVSIVEYARILGFTPKRVGRYYSLKEHDSVIIDENRNCFWRNSDAAKNARGSIIDFVMYFKDINLHDALSELTEMVEGYTSLCYEPITRNYEKQADINKEIELPEKGETKRNIYAYLNKTRGVNVSVINHFVHEKNLYQDNHNNCVFVTYDKENKPEFACKRGTHTEKRFVADVIGSNYKKCFYLDNDSSHMIVTESVIDAMSVMTIIENQGNDFKKYNYQSLSGTQKWEATINIIKENPNIKTVTLALDNDNAGKSAIYEIKRVIQEEKLNVKCIENLPSAKDWNQELLDRREREKKTINKHIDTKNIEHKKRERDIER